VSSNHHSLLTLDKLPTAFAAAQLSPLTRRRFIQNKPAIPRQVTRPAAESIVDPLDERDTSDLERSQDDRALIQCLLPLLNPSPALTPPQCLKKDKSADLTSFRDQLDIWLPNVLPPKPPTIQPKSHIVVCGRPIETIFKQLDPSAEDISFFNGRPLFRTVPRGPIALKGMLEIALSCSCQLIKAMDLAMHGKKRKSPFFSLQSVTYKEV
jgi:hypothetical protein